MIKLCTINEIPAGGAKGFSLNGKNLVVLNYRNEIYIYENSCPHRSIPLEWQPNQFLDYEKTFIQCRRMAPCFRSIPGSAFQALVLKIGSTKSLLPSAITKYL